MPKCQKKELTKLLNQWGFPTGTYACLVKTGEGIALLANLVNWSAKVVDPVYYDLKPHVINAAVMSVNHSSVGVDDYGNRVVYIETSVGQVSFHVYDECEVFDPMRTPDNWDGDEVQPYALELIVEYLEYA